MGPAGKHELAGLSSPLWTSDGGHAADGSRNLAYVMATLCLSGHVEPGNAARGLAIAVVVSYLGKEGRLLERESQIY